MMSQSSWPPQLKDWVARCLSQMTESNKDEAQAELRQVIADSFLHKTLWTTDWQGVQLQSLLPKPTLTFNMFNSLKRKSSDSSTGSMVATHKKPKKSSITKGAAASALDASDQDALSRRAARFQREHEIEKQKQRANQRVTFRSASHYTRAVTPGMFGGDDPEVDPNVPNWDRHTIVGTNQSVLKDYLRLTSDPKPEQIRPYEVLQKTLTVLKKRWKDNKNYNWICSQLKSLRQDLTVQRIKNEFTVNVYEIHARISLEVGDLVEYNACQGMLRNLYDLGIPGNAEEFIAYRILMLIHGRNRSDLNLYVGQLTPAQKSAAPIKHALAVQRAMSTGNYHLLCDLFCTCPNMGGYIMDHFIARERVRALIVMAKAYKTLPLSFIYTELGFDQITDAVDFLQEHRAAHFNNANVPDEEKTLDCRALSAHLTEIFEEKYRKVQIKGAV